jgi:hypothetical protein
MDSVPYIFPRDFPFLLPDPCGKKNHKITILTNSEAFSNWSQPVSKFSKTQIYQCQDVRNQIYRRQTGKFIN